MGSVDDISQLCRLCLVKDQVNIPIFDGSSEIGQTFVKINSCLPVKVSRDDNLPKKICDGCSYKLDMLYIFRNTSVDSEKQLISWLSQSGLSTISQAAAKDPLANAKPEIMVKQETFDSADSRVEGDNPDMGVDAQNYILQQQQLPYQQDFEFGEPSGSIAEMTDEPTPKRAKRAAALKKAPIEDIEETEDDLDAAMQITKAEEEDSEDVDQPDYVEAPSTSADDQPGPSGVGKAPVEAPSKIQRTEDKIKSAQKEQTNVSTVYKCKTCSLTFDTFTKLRNHGHIKYVCPVCHQKLSYSGVRRHLLYIHSGKRDFLCSQCPFTCGAFQTLKNHIIARHTKKYPHVCDICGAGFVIKKRLEVHKKSKHEGGGQLNQQIRNSCGYVKKTSDQTCPVCSKVIVCPVNFKKHMEKHYGIFKGFVCEVCGAILESRQGLKLHRMMHTGEKNFLCTFCGQKFRKKYTLELHMRIHTDEKPHECKYCGKSFRQSSTLAVHMYTHTEKPFKCGTCGRKYSRKNLLRKHNCSVPVPINEEVVIEDFVTNDSVEDFVTNDSVEDFVTYESVVEESVVDDSVEND